MTDDQRLQPDRIMDAVVRLRSQSRSRQKNVARDADTLIAIIEQTDVFKRARVVTGRP